MKQEEVNIEVVSIDDLVQDDHNFNKGNEQGAQLLERSFRECGAGRSVLIDKDNRLVGGNKAQKGFKAAGKKKVIIVDSDADTLVAGSGVFKQADRATAIADLRAAAARGRLAHA